MKSKYLKKKTVRKLKWGDTQAFLNLVEEAYDLLDEDKFNSGYKGCLSDMAVRSYRLAEHLHREFEDGNSDYLKAPVDDLAKAIEDYFTEALKKEE